MRFLLFILLCLIELRSLAQSFHYERISHIDTFYITPSYSFEDNNNLIKTADNNLLLYYDLQYSFVNNSFRYVKFDTTGNILWQKTGNGYNLRELKYGHIIGFNFNIYDHISETHPIPLSYYDSEMNQKWKKTYTPNQPYPYSNYSPKFNFIDTLNQNNYFKYYYNYDTWPDSNQLYITGNIDSLGNLSNIMNEPLIYNSDSVNINFASFTKRTKYLGNYSNRSFFLNSGIKISPWGWWSSKKVYCYAYISSYDSISNKYKYYDIKVDSLTNINGCLMFSNNRVWIYGSKQFQPYVFCISLNGQVLWAKKINRPELATGEYGHEAFTEATILDQNNIIIGKGRADPELFSDEYLLVDSVFKIKDKVYANTITANPLKKINGGLYTYEWGCEKIGIIKTRTLNGVPCWVTNADSLDIKNSQKPDLNYLELSPLSVVSLTINSLNTFTYQPNQDTLIKTNGCIPSCHVQSAPSLVKINSNIIIYPNPTNKLVNINLTGPYDLKLYSSDGKKLKDLEMISFKQFDLSAYPIGMYFFVITQNGITHKVKVLRKE